MLIEPNEFLKKLNRDADSKYKLLEAASYFLESGVPDDWFIMHYRDPYFTYDEENSTMQIVLCSYEDAVTITALCSNVYDVIKLISH